MMRERMISLFSYTGLCVVILSSGMDDKLPKSEIMNGVLVRVGGSSATY